LTRSMKPQIESKNIVAVRGLYEARGNPDIVKTVLAPDVRWEVVEGFPHSGIYQGLNGVTDFLHACSSILKIGTPSQRRFLKQATASWPWAFIRPGRELAADLSRPASRTFGRCATVSSFVFNSARTRCNSRKRFARIDEYNEREGNTWKSLSFGGVAVKISHWPNDQCFNREGADVPSVTC
jgi:hypothetical protein